MTRLSLRALRALLALSLVATTPVLAQNDIIGCADLNCPVDDRSVSNECNVVDRTFINVGAVKVPAVEGFPQGLSWVQGFRVIPMPPNRTYESSFYLGTPPQANFSMPGCAALFTEFQAAKRSERATDGTCDAFMSSKCSNALLKRVQAVKASNSTDNVCRKLQQDLEENLDEDCRPYAGTSGHWQNVTVKGTRSPVAMPWLVPNADPVLAITGTGSEAPKPISSSQNSTSNCWPVPDKSSDLTLYETVGLFVSRRTPSSKARRV